MDTPAAAHRPPPPPATERDTHCRVDSRTLLNGRTTVEIVHGDQRYLLRVTRENKLILTK